MNKKELEAKAAPMFDKYGVDTLYGTSDGNIFILPNRAQLHAGNKHTVYPLKKQVAPVAAPSKETTEEPAKNTVEFTGLTAQMSTKDIVEACKDETDLVVLQAWLNSEVGEKNRKTAVETITKRIDVVVAETTNGTTEPNAGNTTAE